MQLLYRTICITTDHPSHFVYDQKPHSLLLPNIHFNLQKDPAPTETLHDSSFRNNDFSMFTPLESSLGALLLHQSTSLLLYNNGLTLGCSGFMRNLFSSSVSPTTITFFLGMASSVPVLRHFLPTLLTSYPPAPTTLQAALVTAGVGALVGWGSKACNGCTSGHMLCGLSRLSARSALAVGIFFPAAILTHHFAHPGLLTETCTGDAPCYTPVYPSRDTAVSLIVFTALTILIGRILPRMVAAITTAEAKARTTVQQQRAGEATSTSPLANTTTTFLSGLQFALGLHISQMSSPSKVASFLSFPSLYNWDPSLMLIIVFGVLPNLIENHRRGHPYCSDATSTSCNSTQSPAFASRYQVSTKTLKDVDWKFIAGAAVFGCGWGLSGTCPGPAVLRSVMQPQWGALWVGGFWLGGLV